MDLPDNDTEGCTCESEESEHHAPFCTLYVPLENPECFCAEKCTGDLVNEWCDVCYFGIEDCIGADTVAVYNTEDDMTNLYLGDIEIVSDGVINTSNGDGWSYAADTNTLTLNNYNYEGPGKHASASEGYAIIYAEGSLNLVLEGTNTMRMTSNDGGHGILLDLFEYHALNVSGSGSLSINGNNVVNSGGVKYGDFLMESGTLKVTQMAIGVESLRKFTMNGGTLDLDVSVTGIYCPDGVFRIEGGTYYCRCDNYAFQAGTDSRITGGSIISDESLIGSITKLVPEGYVLSESYIDEEIRISGTDTKITVLAREKAVYTDILTDEGLNMAVQDCQSIMIKTVEEPQLV